MTAPGSGRLTPPQKPFMPPLETAKPPETAACRQIAFTLCVPLSCQAEMETVDCGACLSCVSTNAQDGIGPIKPIGALQEQTRTKTLAAEGFHDLMAGVEGGGGGRARAGVRAGAAEEEAANGRAVAGPAD
jgi:hypothetical protein